jgi:hypothetical protein
MGIVIVSVTVTNDAIEQLHRNPSLAWRLYSPEDEEFYTSAIGADKKTHFISRSFGAKQVAITAPYPLFQ